jgi:hypothetical protein
MERIFTLTGGRRPVGSGCAVIAARVQRERHAPEQQSPIDALHDRDGVGSRAGRNGDRDLDAADFARRDRETDASALQIEVPDIALTTAAIDRILARERRTPKAPRRDLQLPDLAIAGVDDHASAVDEAQRRRSIAGADSFVDPQRHRRGARRRALVEQELEIATLNKAAADLEAPPSRIRVDPSKL